MSELERWDEWSKLDVGDRDAIIAESKLAPADLPDVATDDKLLQALDATPLSAWSDRVGVVPARRDQARQRAAKLLVPESVTVTLPSATIKPGELDLYLDQVRAQIQPHLDSGKTVII